jgi:hypothetical protein
VNPVNSARSAVCWTHSDEVLDGASVEGADEGGDDDVPGADGSTAGGLVSVSKLGVAVGGG